MISTTQKWRIIPKIATFKLNLLMPSPVLAISLPVATTTTSGHHGAFRIRGLKVWICGNTAPPQVSCPSGWITAMWSPRPKAPYGTTDATGSWFTNPCWLLVSWSSMFGNKSISLQEMDAKYYKYCIIHVSILRLHAVCLIVETPNGNLAVFS